MGRAEAAMFVLVSIVLVCGTSATVKADKPTAEQIEKMKAAAPEKAAVKAEQPRRLLVFNLCKGFRHSSIECGAKALEIMGQKTGAYEAVISDDVAMFTPDKLRQFDAICFNNTTGELFDDPALQQSLLDFVKGGKGIVGIHAATDCFYKWPEFGGMMGGYFHGHPWGANDTVTLKIEEPDHPLCAPFESKTFVVMDEIYQFREPYSRQKLRVLLSLDTGKTDMKKGGIKRTDGDFAISWVRPYGKGRVFYCSLGHREDIFWNPTVLRHYLAGIQYAFGDLKADAAPSASLEESGWVPLFNGQDLVGWKGLVGNPVTRAKMSPEELGQAQVEADRKMRTHWKVEDGVLVFDGSGEGSHLCTAKDYGDLELLVDWKIETDGDSGIYLRGSPQVQIWDPAQHPEGSGGLYNNKKHVSKPLKCADRLVGEWNTFRIKMVGERVTVYLNDVLVTDDVVMENYWERDKPICATGQIELQSHGTPLYFKNIRIRQID
jgi:type 1 glutamine amidotransferase